jgi:DNA-binding transcriptional regulator PaaX
VRKWVLLLYKVPPEPSARRVYVWRKLKRLGALLLHDAVWVLPAAPATLEQFQWLATEIKEMEGSALVWEATLPLDGQDNALVSRFLAQVEAGYRDILAALADPGADLPALSRRYQHLHAQDYFQAALGMQVRQALAAASAQVEEGGNEA